MRVASTYSIVVVALLAASPARTAPPDRDLPRPDPPGVWHVITQDDATTTSKCLVQGEPKTALCAIEYNFACFLRKDSELCRIARPSEAPIEFKLPALDRATKYRVLAVRRFASQKEIDWWTRRGEFWRNYLRIGDVMIVIDDVQCNQTFGCGDGGKQPTRYFVRKAGARWVYLGGHKPVYRVWEKPPKL
jgi:hypothetical protein